MSLREVKLNYEYRSFKNDIVLDFYIPVLSKAKNYKRAVGFFSSTALIEISKGIGTLAKKGGSIQLLTSPILSEEDIEAMKLGYKMRDKIISKKLIDNLYSYDEKSTDKERLNLLANLVADGTLDIKVILLEDNGYGMYHEKMGIISDENQNKVVFSGSMNESVTSMKVNYESIDVFCSWKGDDVRIHSKEETFDKMWNNEYKNTRSIEIPNVKDEFIKRYKTGTPNYDLDQDIRRESEEGGKIKKEIWINKPEYIEDLHDYQKDAINSWEEKDFSGIFDMATGTGKTLTALGGLSRLAQNSNNELGIIIICPYQHLVEQWVEDIEACGVDPLICYSAYRWKKDFKRHLRNFSMGIFKKFFIVTTNSTFTTDFFQEQVDKINGNVCLVVDEAHNFGTKRQISCMKDIYKFRLGLSATIERHRDEEGTQKLYEFFGDKCIEYSLKRAIAEKKLTRYYYYPIPILLTDEEFEEYEELSKKIGSLSGGIKDDKIPEGLEMLLIKRARIIAGASNKIDALVHIIKKDYINDNQMLVYCGSANVTYSSYQKGKPEIEEKRQIEAVLDKLGNELGMRVSKFTSEEDYKERELIKKRFAKGDTIQTLVAIRCLDEGVNIPSIETAFILASSTNPKEYIQRRGRVLRLYEEKTHANIYDFIALPRNLKSYINTYNISSSEINLVKKELVRVEEFSRLAENESDSDKLKQEIKEAYNIGYIEGDDIYE